MLVLFKSLCKADSAMKCPKLIEQKPLNVNARPCGLMDKALVFGTKDCRFESCQGHVFALVLAYAYRWTGANAARFASRSAPSSPSPKDE